MSKSDDGKVPRCPRCGAPTRWVEGPPWDPRRAPDDCARCENRDLDEAEQMRVAECVAAAARAGRFDCI